MLAMKQFVSISFERENVICEPTEAVVQRCSEISQNSQENTCARVSLLMKLQALPGYLFLDSGTGVFLRILWSF